eukprot:5510809-Prorocentrum_lima.AAC.1
MKHEIGAPPPLRKCSSPLAAGGGDSGRLQPKRFEALLRQLLPDSQAFPLSTKDGDVRLLWRMCES